MITVITGGSKCGKSALAEKTLSSCGGRKIYIATMEPYCEDALEAIERHHKMRLGKGFETVEQYRDIESTCIPEGSSVLLECMGNLLANEMFTPDGKVNAPVEKILSGIKKLSEKAADLIIVTNQVGDDGTEYSPETMLYIKYLGEINSGLSAMAQNVTECVYGIPVVLKGNVR